MQIRKAIVITLSLLVFLVGCRSKATEESDPETVLTQAMQTAMARITMTPSTQVTVTNTFQPIPSMTVSPTGLTSPTNTTVPTQGAPSANSACDNAGFVADITIPDGTEMPPASRFAKTWELRNDGTCTWNSSYQVVFYSGAQMSATASQQLTQDTVAPGQTIQITINMIAPQEAGRHLGYWLLRNADGENFGIGGPASTFYVDISVAGSPVVDTATATKTKDAPIVSNTPAPTNTQAPVPTDTGEPTPTNTTAPYPTP